MDMHKIDHSFDREVDVTLSTVTLVIDLIFDFFATPTFSENQKPDSNKQLTLTSNSLIYTISEDSYEFKPTILSIYNDDGEKGHHLPSFAIHCHPSDFGICSGSPCRSLSFGFNGSCSYG